MADSLMEPVTSARNKGQKEIHFGKLVVPVSQALMNSRMAHVAHFL